MSNFSKEKDYIKNEYARYWIKARREKYGCTDYDYALLDHLDREIIGSKLVSCLDVCCGSGFPFGEHLIHKTRYLGIDLSALLIEEAKKAYGDSHFVVGDAEALEFKDNTFDVTLCFHSMFFIPNYMAAIDEMIRVTKPQGTIIFELMNDRCPFNIKNLKKLEFEATGVGKAFRITKNIVKMALQIGTPKWSDAVHLRLNSVTNVLSHLRQLNVVELTTYSVSLEKLHFENGISNITKFPKVLIQLKKGS